MEQSPKTSFIPKQTIGVARTRQRKSFNVFTFVAMVFFLSVLTLSIAVYFYREYNEAQLQLEKERLASLRSNFAQGEIESIRELDQRLLTAKYLMDRHLTVSEVFDALEANVQENAQITSFAYTRENSGNARLVLGGRALSFNTVALQEQRFGNEQAFKAGSVTFSDLNTTQGSSDTEEEERVIFTIGADLDPAVIRYEADPILEEVVEESVATSTPDITDADDASNTDGSVSDDGITTP